MGLSVDRGEYAGQDAIVCVVSVVERVVVGLNEDVLAVMDDEVAVQRPVGVADTDRVQLGAPVRAHHVNVATDARW